MPIYEYSCKKCGKTIEVIQKFSDNPLKKHASCGGTLTKLISASGFQFKGTGWYVTDYAKKSGGGESGEKGGEGESASAKPESKDSASTASTATATSSKESSPAAPPAKAKPSRDSKKSSDS